MTKEKEGIAGYHVSGKKLTGEEVNLLLAAKIDILETSSKRQCSMLV